MRRFVLLRITLKRPVRILDDAPGLASYINGRAQYGLRFKEEQQLLSGDGTGANILGILPQATEFAPALTLSNATPNRPSSPGCSAGRSCGISGVWFCPEPD
ncbi:phage major capsid protein [Klebsiella pneumoniae]